MSIQISRLTEADIPGVVKAIQEAFDNDPYNNWVFDKSKFNPQRNAVSLSIRSRWGMRNAMFYVAKEEGSDNVLGVSMWLPPQRAGGKQSWHDWYEGWRMWAEQVAMNAWYGRGGLNVKVSGFDIDTDRVHDAGPSVSVPDLRYFKGIVKSSSESQRYYIWKAAQEKAHASVWTDPRGYYFLNIMVVIPEAQGKGIGKKLVTVVTDKADAEGMNCYLESSKDKPNMQIYERMGFKFARALDCDDNGAVCNLFCMVREPKAP